MSDMYEPEMDRDYVLDRFIADGDWTGAEDFAHSVDELWQRAESLARLARALAKAGRPTDAMRIRSDAVAVAREGELSNHVQDSLDSSSMLWELAVDLMGSGERDRALDVARRIANAGKRQRALETLEQLAPDAL